MPSDPLDTSDDYQIVRAHAPTIMVNTPEGTRKPNGITPPLSQAAATAKTAASNKYDIKTYHPTDYIGLERGDSGRISPSPTPSRLIGTGTGTSATKFAGPVGASDMDAYLQPQEHMGKQDPRQKRPGDASSFYGGTPPTYPPPPGMESVAGTQYNMSGALPVTATTTGGGYQAQYGGGGHVVGGGSTVSMSGPAAFLTSGPTLGRERGLRAARVDTETVLREYLDLQHKVRLGARVEDKERLNKLAGRALHEVKELRKEIGTLVKRKEGGRVGRFVVGGIVAGTIPLIKQFFRRPSDSAASKTEYAYTRSHSMVKRILSALHKTGWAASVFMFVLAALYVFQAEVMIRVAKTVYKRLKRLVIKMEEGERLGRDGMVVMEDGDLNVLKGWRWRVLLWSK